MVYRRRRGTAIVDTPHGILVVSQNGRTFTLPGGGARPAESERDAAARELMEETGMEAVELAYLFAFMGVLHRGTRGGFFRNAHQVFLVRATGTPEPGHEVKRVAYYDGSGLRLTYSAKRIIERYRASGEPPRESRARTRR